MDVTTQSREEFGLFTRFIAYLAAGGYTVIALHDLARYVDPAHCPGDPYAAIAARQCLQACALTCEYAPDPPGRVHPQPFRSIIPMNDCDAINRRAAMSHLDATGGRVGRLDNLVQATPNRSKKGPHTMQNNPLPRLDSSPDLRKVLLPYCRLQLGDMWTDPVRGHRVGCLDAANPQHVSRIMENEPAQLAIQDPPYNVATFQIMSIEKYIQWCRTWVSHTSEALAEDSSLYIWLGADQNDGFQPLPDFILMMRDQPFSPRSMITMRNQRGYGTQKNWMAVRQELLYYMKGRPRFYVDAEYTDIPKILRGYYKTIKGKTTENLERSRSDTIRAGNVWVDVQQVFYRMQENVSGCYAQKPIKSIDRIIRASSSPGDLVIDYFAHSGTTLIAAELLGRKCYTFDVDPIYTEIVIRRLEHMRATGKAGWQSGHPFETESPELTRTSDVVSEPDFQQTLF